MNDQVAKVATIDSQLRRIERSAWAVVTNENGWTYSTNIGLLVHHAADDLAALRAQLAEAQAERDKFRAEVNRQARAALAEAEADTLDATERVILMRRDNQRAAAARRVAAYCRELRKQVDATAFHALQSVLSDAPYTQDDIERGNSLTKEHGWDA